MLRLCSDLHLECCCSKQACNDIILSYIYTDDAVYIHIMGLFQSLQRWGLAKQKISGWLLALSKGSSSHFFSFFAEKGSGKSESIAWFVEGDGAVVKSMRGLGFINNVFSPTVQTLATLWISVPPPDCMILSCWLFLRSR